ncbi:MAG: radical SAM/SPASM domain-containing protein [Promethearchaeota archaeon]
MKKTLPEVVYQLKNSVYINMGRIFIPWIIKHIRSLPSVIRLVIGYRKSAKVRKKELLNGIMVPPFLIISITSRCNLRCAGCYAAATGTVCKNSTKKSLNLNQWQEIINDAKQLGVFGFLIAGGEPFILSDLLRLCEDNEDRLFIILTNGTLLKERDFKRLQKLKNAVIMVSVEGNRFLTDQRRGRGVHEKALNTIQKLNKLGVLNGVSVTITRNNFRYWMNEKNIDYLIAKGIKLGFFIEYIPVENGTNLMLSNEESKEFRKRILYYRQKKSILIIHSPGDEEYAGGCVSAGRGFAHITPGGDLTPCPVSNIATHNLKKSSLREGLKSPLFKIIRENEHLLETNGSPCALFAHPEEVTQLAKLVNAYKTGN